MLSEFDDGATAGGSWSAKESNPLLVAVKKEFPHLIPKVMAARTEAYPAPPHAELVKRTLALKKDEEQSSSVPDFEMPWQVLLVALGGWVAFHIVSSNMSLGPLLPVINAVGIVLMIYFGFFKDMGNDE